MQRLMLHLCGSQSFYQFKLVLKKEVFLLWSHPNVPFYHKTRILLRNFFCIQWFGGMTTYCISVQITLSGKLE